MIIIFFVIVLVWLMILCLLPQPKNNDDFVVITTNCQLEDFVAIEMFFRQTEGQNVIFLSESGDSTSDRRELKNWVDYWKKIGIIVNQKVCFSPLPKRNIKKIICLKFVPELFYWDLSEVSLYCVFNQLVRHYMEKTKFESFEEKVGEIYLYEGTPQNLFFDKCCCPHFFKTFNSRGKFRNLANTTNTCEKNSSIGTPPNSISSVKIGLMLVYLFPEAFEDYICYRNQMEFVNYKTHLKTYYDIPIEKIDYYSSQALKFY